MLGDVKSNILFPSDIVSDKFDPSDYYSVLPGMSFTLSEDWPSFDLTVIAKQLETLESSITSPADIIDNLTLALLAHGTKHLPTEFEWSSFADRLALLYIREAGDFGNRSLRMKAQRANYYLRAMIDIDYKPDCEVIDEIHLNVNYPWDFEDIGGDVYIGSGDGANIHSNSSYFGHRSFRLGKPTQIVRLSEGSIALCSCYQNGWHELCYEQPPIFWSHDRPVILVFTEGHEEYFLDVEGRVFKKHSREMILRLPVHFAWRARRLGELIFVFDLSGARSLIVLRLDGWQVSVINTDPVLLINDLCSAPDGYYLIDKMQGRIFLFDEEFRFMQARLAFGIGYGALSDPIAIRTCEDKIQVLSWLGNRLTVVRQF